MANLKNTTITDTGYLLIPTGTTATRKYFDPSDDKAIVEQFTTIGANSWTCPANVSKVDVLIVGGGGAGGFGHGGGGGGGAVIYKKDHSVTPGQSYSFSVGTGGGRSTSDSANNLGSSSTAFGQTATGGGSGANEPGNDSSGRGGIGGTGANGGGGGYDYRLGGTGTRPSVDSGWIVYAGNRGGTGGEATNRYPEGGGAGAGGPGGDASSKFAGGGGGPGVMIDITGQPYYWGGGGGGVVYSGGTGGSGGLGGGGGAAVVDATPGLGDRNGINPGTDGQNGPNVGTAGTGQIGGDGGANTGGGGGAGANEVGTGGAGGSGIVVLRYKTDLTISPTGFSQYNTDINDLETFASRDKKYISSNIAKNMSGHNLFYKSLELGSANWIRQNTITVTDNYAEAPDGTQTASRVIFGTGSLPRMFQVVNLAGKNAVLSCWIKSNTASDQIVTLHLRQYNFGSTYRSNSFVATQEWQRVYITAEIPNNITQIHGMLYQSSSSSPTNDVLIWGMQIEEGTSPSPFTYTDTARSLVPSKVSGTKIHAFTDVGTASFVPSLTGEVELLIVGGGGGGGANHAGGGGGGGVIYKESYPVISGETYLVTVGEAGTGSITYNGPPGVNGGNSRFGHLVAIGGGGGGNRYDVANANSPGQSGGSGGGGGGAQAIAALCYNPGMGVEGQGYPGGRAIDIYGGGGGGAGGPGTNGLGGQPGRTGLGGVGLYFEQFKDYGQQGWFAGGGGGSSGSESYIGYAGRGGGGNAAGANISSSGTPPQVGLANTGGGGGGGSAGGGNGADGGSGIVLVRYRV